MVQSESVGVSGNQWSGIISGLRSNLKEFRTNWYESWVEDCRLRSVEVRETELGGLCDSALMALQLYWIRVSLRTNDYIHREQIASFGGALMTALCEEWKYADVPYLYQYYVDYYVELCDDSGLLEYTCGAQVACYSIGGDELAEGLLFCTEGDDRGIELTEELHLLAERASEMLVFLCISTQGSVGDAFGGGGASDLTMPLYEACGFSVEVE